MLPGTAQACSVPRATSSTMACGMKRALSRVIALSSSRMPMPQAWSPMTQLPISG
jgi:hypothetical protein